MKKSTVFACLRQTGPPAVPEAGARTGKLHDKKGAVLGSDLRIKVH